MNFNRNQANLIIFDRGHCQQLLKAKKIKEAELYLNYFFFNYQTKIFFFNGYEFILYTREEAMKLISDDLTVTQKIANTDTEKFEKTVYSLKNYLKSVEFMKTEYKPTIDFRADLVITKIKKIRNFDFTENYLNMAKPLNNDVITGVAFKVTKDIVEKTNLIHKHIELILCSGNKECYEYVLNFIACTLNGRKLRKALYVQSKERTGKGMIINDVLKKILGDRMHKTNSVESILKYSKPFEGCCLINFDELPHSDNYKGVQDNLKSLITESIFICRDMFTTGYEQQNTFNIIITTNNDAVSLTQTNNSRYVCLDVDESKIGDIKYFKHLSDAISTPHVLEHFYNQMKLRYDKLDWNEDNMPFTESRKLKIIEALPQLYKYIKEQFILTNIDINMRTDEFLEEYRLITKDKTSNQKLGRLLTAIDIVSSKNSNNMGYNYKKSANDLLKIFEERKWIDAEVDFINSAKECNEPNMFINDIDKAVMIRIDDHKTLIDTKDTNIDSLTEKNDLLKTDLHDAMKYIKELEARIYKIEESFDDKPKNDCMFIEKKPTKKSKANEYVEIADGVIINKSTNEELTKESIDDDDDDFFT